MSRRIHFVLVPALFAVLVSCAGTTRIQSGGATSPAVRSPSASAAPSPTISIYPVPHRTPGTPGTPRSTPSQIPPADVASDAPSDVTGIPCGEEVAGTDHHVGVTTRYTCYEVSGTTPQQLQAGVEKEGPRANGRVAAAVTHWRLRWSYAFIEGASSCEVVRPDVQVVIVYVLPAWTPPAGVSVTTTEYWRNFSTAVKAHEAHHKSIAIDGGVAARKALLDLAPGPTCPEVSDTANAEVKAIIAQFEAKQRAFDAGAGG